MALAGIDQIVVDFVGNEDQVVPPGEFRHRLQLCFRPDPPAGVVRRAEDEHALVARHGRIPALAVEDVPPLGVLRHRQLDQPAARGANFLGEGVIDRREQNDAIARRGVGVDTECGAVHEAVGIEDPVGLHRPAVPLGHPPANGGTIGAIVAEIAVDAMGVHRRNGIGHHLGRAKFHIRHPHRQTVLGGDAVEPFHHVPFDAMGTAAVDHFVEGRGGVVQRHRRS